MKNTADELAFENYFAATLARVDIQGGTIRLDKINGLIAKMTLSPDGKMVIIKRVQRPFPI